MTIPTVLSLLMDRSLDRIKCGGSSCDLRRKCRIGTLRYHYDNGLDALDYGLGFNEETFAPIPKLCHVAPLVNGSTRTPVSLRIPGDLKPATLIGDAASIY